IKRERHLPCGRPAAAGRPFHCRASRISSARPVSALKLTHSERSIMVEKFGIGQPVPRTEDPRLLTGGGNYLDDVTLPRQVRAFVLRSPFAAAHIRSIDTAAAKAAPGVLDVLTAEDYDAA